MFKHLVLALLAERNHHGYELRSEFEELFGGTWPLNIGQVYTTLGRLERDGLVECHVVPQDPLPDRKEYSITDAGWRELIEWMSAPVTGKISLKDEFFAKVLAHALVDHGDPLRLIWQQRQRYLETLAQLTRLRDQDGVEPVTALLVEGAIMHAEADLRWLDECERRLPELKRG